MKKKHKSIFGKLISSYIIFTLVAIVGIVGFFVLALIQSVDTQGKVPEYPYIAFEENGELWDYEQLEAFGGWVEELDENYAVVKTFGEKKTEQMSYTEKEMISYFDKAMRANGAGEYRVFYHETNDYRYLIFFPDGLFQIVFNINNNGMVYTSFNKVILVGLLVFLGLEVLGISFYISRRITKPMTSISEGMAKVAAGETNVNIPIYEEKEFVEIQDSFVKMQDALYRQKAEKEDILNKRHQMLLELSHDIKTPVATIKSYATALSENMVPEEELQKYYSTISRKADRVNNLTMDLFTMLKMESEEYQVTKEKMNFSEMVRTILANLYEDFIADGYELDIDVPEEDIYTLGDENYLTRAVENLLNNARKYNIAGKNIAVHLTKTEDKLSLKVMDDGTPIDEETRKTMFLAFARGEKSRSSDGGTGLGLAITKQIIEKHGGKIGYTYQDGMNCFEMILFVMKDVGSVDLKDKNKENIKGDEKMNQYYSLLEIGKLDLKYPVTVNGLDGECFTYGIYFDDADIASKCMEIEEAVGRFVEAHDDDDYPGYLDVSDGGNKVVIYHDLGNTDGSNRPIHGLLKVIDSVSNVKKVIINEDIIPMSEDDMMQKMLEIMRMNGYEG